jgi:DNA topoisomerase II
MNLAFKKQMADNRKEWLYNYNPKQILDNNITNVPIADFIDNELIHFSNSDTKRSIGSVFDGLKPSQRKILYCCFKRKLYSEIRVAQLAGYVSEHASYHHGEASLQSTIIGMAQTFIGSNNINLLKPNGQFGSRIMGGSDSASPRYIHTELNKIINLIYPISDFDLLHREEDDGILIEPTYYVPIIPMVIVNGMKGIGTGFSTDIPQYNPKDIINNIKNKINNKSYKKLIPWYNKFTGKIIELSPNKFQTKGKYDIIDKNTIVISELPIGTWTSNYKEFLNNCIIDKKDKSNKNKFIIDYEDHSTDDTIKFVIKMTTNVSQFITYNEKDKLDSIERMFKLSTTKNTNNIHLYTSTGSIKKYNTINDIVDDFYTERYNLYDLRKKNQLQKLENEILIYKSKMKFIEYVIDDTIVVFKNSEKNIINSLVEYKFPYLIDGKIVPNKNKPIDNCYNYLINISLNNFTNEKISELKIKINKLESEYKIIKEKTINQIWIYELKLLEKSL